VSIDPILAKRIREELVRRPDHSRIVIAVSPIIKGSTIKGPAAKMFFELGIEPSAMAVADHYGARKHGGLLDGFILDDQDEEISSQVEEMGVIPFSTNTFMKSNADRKLAEKISLGNKVLPILPKLGNLLDWSPKEDTIKLWGTYF
jgi:LPPG:FO 2-phospho-L-lactate transferase